MGKKRILVTGASSGIGRACAARFAEQRLASNSGESPIVRRRPESTT
jgi:NAD(P)-dependent dehydrogenase (short-subunit alcohol dehydrogenase family)